MEHVMTILYSYDLNTIKMYYYSPTFLSEKTKPEILNAYFSFNNYIFRVLSVPIVQRIDNLDEEKPSMNLVGHPNILHMPSNISALLLYDTVDRILPSNGPFTLLLTDGQVLHSLELIDKL